jgi:putative peptidoglycan lipid II flippase
MIKKGITVTLIFGISTFVQLISQIVVTRLFGASLNLDTFLSAVTLPTIIVTVIYGTLNDAFLPLFGEKKNTEENSDSYFINNVIVLAFISFVVALIFNFLSLPISTWLYGSRGETFIKDVATQMNFMFYSMPLSVIATLFGSYFYTHKKFNRFPIAQGIGSIANLAIIIALAPIMGTWGMVIAFVVSILVQILFVIPTLKWDFSFSLKRIDLFPILIAWIPLIIGSFALRSDSLLIRSFGSSLPDGYLVYLNLISKIFSLATSVMTIGIQVLLLPHLVEYFAQKDYGRAIVNVNKAKFIATGIAIGVTLVLALIAPLFINLIFVGGKFTKEDADVTISLLPLFILPAIGWCFNSIFFQPLLALKKQFQVGLINVIALMLGWGGGYMVKMYVGPTQGITVGLTILLFSGIIGSEILWQHYKRNLK